jgi:tRNA pseudouridine55 synthase
MKRFVVLDKKIGETPLAAIGAWKKENQEYAHLPASYAGRLDPMASGKLLVLLGEECKRQREYTNLDKEYEIEVLLDIGSDTGDVLGMPEYAGRETLVDESTLAAALASERGAHLRAYPAFSSKTVSGKPLFLHALEGALPYMVVPEHIEHIYSIQHQGSYTISDSDLEARVSALLDLVPRTDEPSKRLGEDFRVDAVRARWQELFITTRKRNFTVLRLRVTCASGTYMRSLAGRLGAALGTSALALSIRRTKIGKYLPILGDMGFWAYSYK